MSQKSMDLEARNIIVEAFKRRYGFAPCKKDIIFLEGASTKGHFKLH